MRVKLDKSLYRINEAAFQIFLEVDHHNKDVKITNEIKGRGFVFDSCLDKKTVEKWEKVIKLLGRAIEIIKQELK